MGRNRQDEIEARLATAIVRLDAFEQRLDALSRRLDADEKCIDAHMGGFAIYETKFADVSKTIENRLTDLEEKLSIVGDIPARFAAIDNMTKNLDERLLATDVAVASLRKPPPPQSPSAPRKRFSCF